MAMNPMSVSLALLPPDQLCLPFDLETGGEEKDWEKD